MLHVQELAYGEPGVLGFAATWPQAAAALPQPAGAPEFDWEGDRPLGLPMEDLVRGGRAGGRRGVLAAAMLAAAMLAAVLARLTGMVRPAVLLMHCAAGPWMQVIYEMHVRGFTADSSSGVSAPGERAVQGSVRAQVAAWPGAQACLFVCVAHALACPPCPRPSALPSAGTFRGIVEKLDYIAGLGVNAIELMPVHEFNELEYYQVGGVQLRGWVGAWLLIFAASSKPLYRPLPAPLIR